MHAACIEPSQLIHYFNLKYLEGHDAAFMLDVPNLFTCHEK
jgi:hypothetical protein